MRTMEPNIQPPNLVSESGIRERGRAGGSVWIWFWGTLPEGSHNESQQRSSHEDSGRWSSVGSLSPDLGARVCGAGSRAPTSHPTASIWDFFCLQGFQLWTNSRVQMGSVRPCDLSPPACPRGAAAPQPSMCWRQAVGPAAIRAHAARHGTEQNHSAGMGSAWLHQPKHTLCSTGTFLASCGTYDVCFSVLHFQQADVVGWLLESCRFSPVAYNSARAECPVWHVRVK